MKTQIIEFLTDHSTAKMSEITESIGLKSSRTRDYMRELISEGIVVAEGANRNRTYRLKACRPFIDVMTQKYVISQKIEIELVKSIVVGYNTIEKFRDNSQEY